MVNTGQFKEITCNNYAGFKKLYRSMLVGSELTTAQSVRLKNEENCNELVTFYLNFKFRCCYSSLESVKT